MLRGSCRGTRLTGALPARAGTPLSPRRWPLRRGSSTQTLTAAAACAWTCLTCHQRCAPRCAGACNAPMQSAAVSRRPHPACTRSAVGRAAVASSVQTARGLAAQWTQDPVGVGGWGRARHAWPPQSPATAGGSGRWGVFRHPPRQRPLACYSFCAWAPAPQPSTPRAPHRPGAGLLAALAQPDDCARGRAPAAGRAQP